MTTKQHQIIALCVFLTSFSLASPEKKAQRNQEEKKIHCTEWANYYAGAYFVFLPKALAQLKIRYSEFVDLKIQESPKKPEGWDGVILAVAVARDKQKYVLGTMKFKVEKGWLSVDTDVIDGVQDLGASKLMFLWLMQQKPAISRRSVDLFGTNFDSFITAMTHPPFAPKDPEFRQKAEEYALNRAVHDQTNADFVAELGALKTAKAIQIYRERLLRAFSTFTPTGRVSAEAGFRKVHSIKITLLPERGFDVKIEVERDQGRPTNYRDTQVLVIDARSGDPVERELAFSGEASSPISQLTEGDG